MRWTAKDSSRWRHRFAIFPVKIGDHWIWLEWYWVKWWGDHDLVEDEMEHAWRIADEH